MTKVERSVEVDVPISIVEAVRGGTIEVPTLGGRKKLRVAAGTKHGTVQRLRGEGPPRPSGNGRGDIRYRFVIDVPENLSPQQAAAPPVAPAAAAAFEPAGGRHRAGAISRLRCSSRSTRP